MLPGVNPSHSGPMDNAGAIGSGLLVEASALRLAGLPAFALPSGCGQIPTLTKFTMCGVGPAGRATSPYMASFDFGLSTRPKTIAVALSVWWSYGGPAQQTGGAHSTCVAAQTLCAAHWQNAKSIFSIGYPAIDRFRGYIGTTLSVAARLARISSASLVRPILSYSAAVRSMCSRLETIGPVAIR